MKNPPRNLWAKILFVVIGVTLALAINKFRAKSVNNQQVEVVTEAPAQAEVTVAAPQEVVVPRQEVPVVPVAVEVQKTNSVFQAGFTDFKVH